MRILFCILVIFTFFVDTAKGTDTFVIKLNDNSIPVQYCTTPELIAKDLTIGGSFAITGMKISFSEGYKSAEDELTYTGSIGNIVSTWYSGQGYLLLKGDGNTTKENYRDAIKLVTYKNNKSVPTLGIRKISITLEDADFLPETGHFYRFVEKSNMSWSAAKTEAESATYYDLKGYLATITSSVENDFIKLKTKGVGWIGASDAGAEGQWRWVTGPEGMEDNNKGRPFYVTGSGPVAGEFTNWNSGEPNDCCDDNRNHEEDYAHITVFPNNPSASYKWNDLPDSGGQDDYASKGYLIEFGGFLGEPDMSLSATLVLQVNTMLFNTGTISEICEGKSYMLNMADLNAIPATYTWTPAESLSSSTAANPYATPKVTTTYTVTGNRGACSNKTTYTIPVNPKPVSKLIPVENICTGQTKTLDPGSNQGYTYLWNNGSTSQTITVNAAAVYNVTVTSDKLCSADFKSEVVIYKYPSIELKNLQKLICGDAKTTLVDITTDGTDGYSLKSTNSNVTINGLKVSVPDFGIYPMVYTVNHQYCPSKENFSLSFYKNPKGTLIVNGQAEGQKCFGYNLDAVFNPEGDLTGANYEWEFGGAAIASGIGLNTQVVPLGISLAKRDLKLTVTQDGCSTPFIEPNILVIPNLSLTTDKNLGCEPLVVVFTATSEGAVKYNWVFGDSNVIIPGLTPDQKHTYQNAGFYDVHLKVTTGDDCTNEVKIPKMIHAAPIPDVAFSLSANDCLEPGENQISYAGFIGTDKDTYIWNLDNFDASEKLNDPLGTPGPFLFNLKNKPMATIGLKVTSEFGCESLPGSFLVKRKPDFSIQSDLLVGCVPFESTLSGLINENDKVDKVDFSWDFGDGTIGSGSPTLHTYNAPGKNFNVILNGKSSVTGCLNVETGTDLLKTYPEPTAKFRMDNKIVYNDKPDVKFTDLSLGASDWLWHFGEESTSAEQNPIYHFIKMGPQMVTLEVSNTEGCTDVVSDTVLVAFNRLFPPNGFSPNAPNSVDRVFLLNSEGITPEGYHFTVLSRWNDVVFETKGEIKGWDGRMINGTFAPAGAYVWILNFTDFIGRKHQQTGTVTLVY